MIPKSARWLLPLLALVFLLAACGTAGGGVATIDDPDDGATATPAPSVDPEDAIFAFAECMREHGIDMPDPQIVEGGPGGGGGMSFNRDRPDGDEAPQIDPNSEEFQAALEACRDLMDGFAAGPGDGPELTPEQEQALLDFTECMREHGIDMPDPVNGGISIGPGDGGEPPFDPQSDEFQEAQEACREHLDGARPGPAAPGQQSQ